MAAKYQFCSSLPSERHFTDLAPSKQLLKWANMKQAFRVLQLKKHPSQHELSMPVMSRNSRLTKFLASQKVIKSFAVIAVT
ncbi:hypothetical protein [Vibrio sp. 16]|uniref:hypothetical protein n=1 Tax=Vibrio sp. 16 TaxID=391586 RepID=UPI00018F2048|nr:hypothetical protein [Vibrio sp. 16]EED25891.1 hypothetical protein VPMS16_1434 [Vibrio sp. 16]